MSTKRNAKQNDPFAMSEALCLIRSAIGLGIEAGLFIGARNGRNGLVLTIVGAEVVYREDGAADFVPQSSVPQSVPQPVPQDLHLAPAA